MRPVIFCLAIVMALPAQAQGTLTGHVRDPAGFGIAGAEVRLTGGQAGTFTDANGAFKVQGLLAGVVTVSARRIGFRPGMTDVTIRDGQTTDMIVVLDFTPLQLEQVRVTAKREPFDNRLAGFQARSLKHVGTFITRERIEASASASFSDMLRSVPGVRMVTSGAAGIRNAVRFRGYTCAPLVFVDGFPASADEFDVDIIDLSSVEGVEIYMGMLTVPPEFVAPRGLEHCGVIAVWSRPFRSTKRPAKTVTQAELQRMVDSSAVYTVGEVDTPASVEPGTFYPVYPDALWKTGTGGQALVEFVVDALGRVEMDYFSIVSASHAEFGEAVRQAVARARFVPATKGGRHVRQLVQLPTRFDRPKP